jgi:hypothetical protein
MRTGYKPEPALVVVLPYLETDFQVTTTIYRYLHNLTNFALYLIAAVSNHLYFVSSLKHLPGTLANDDTRRHCVAGCDARHDGPIRNAKVVDSIDL